MTRRGSEASGQRPPAMTGAAGASADPLAPTYRKALELHRSGQLREAEQAYRRILTIHARHVEAAHALAMLLHQTGRTAQAEPLLRGALALQPAAAPLLAHLAVVLLALDRPIEALVAARQAVKSAPDSSLTQTQLAAALLATGHAAEAVQAGRRAIRLDPNDAMAQAQLGRALLATGHAPEAATHLAQAIALQPAFADAHAWHGDALAAAGAIEPALASYKAAVALVPAHAGAHFGLATVHAQLGRWPAAADNFRAAIYARPTATAFAGLAEALLALGRPDDAADAAETAVRLAPEDAAIAARRLKLLTTLGRPILPPGGPLSALERDEIRYRMAVEVTPGNAVALGNLGGALLELGRLEEACAYFRQALALQPDYFHVWSELLFSINYLGDMPVGDMVAEARRYGAAMAAASPVHGTHANSPDPERRLRVGLVSADLRAHPVARFLEAPLAKLDAGAIELVAYDVGSRHDAVTQRLRSIIPHWRDAAGWSDAQLESTIVGDAIDILVDLSGHTVGNRLPVFARKPAPIAVTWLGYFATTGLAAIDYVLASPTVLPPDEAGQWVETPWYLPETYLCFTPPQVAVPLAPPPATRNGFVTFGSANALNKLSDGTIACWARVLDAVPESRLLLRSPPLVDGRLAAVTRQRFAAKGVNPDHLLLDAGTADYAGHLGRYNDIDIALDPFPYAGGTTTAESLWMGVPVLTLRGDRYVSHMGENILGNLGLRDWIAADIDDYVAKAAAFAADVPALAALRQNLRQRLMASPIGDAPRFAAALEAAFRGMWRTWCATHADR